MFTTLGQPRDRGHAGGKLAQEEVWIRQGIKARRTRDEGRVRRLKAMRSERAVRRDLTGNVRPGCAAAGPPTG